MRALMIVAVLALAVGCGSKKDADQASASPGASGDANPAVGGGAAGGIGTDTFTAEVVDVDGKAGTITLRAQGASASGAGAAIRRMPVTGAGKEQLRSVKAGDQVVVGCDDAEAGAGSRGGVGEPGQGAPTDGGSVGGTAAPSSGAARTERPTSSGPDGSDSGVGPSGTESLSTCRAVRSVTPIAGGGESASR